MDWKRLFPDPLEYEYQKYVKIVILEKIMKIALNNKYIEYFNIFVKKWKKPKSPMK